MSDTVALIYFESLDRNEVCPTLDAFKTHKVANQKPASVIIYDYYDNGKIPFFSLFNALLISYIFTVNTHFLLL